ncbi:hypothetical protein Lesp02_85160 [Lentzea sp. NBRC 105346]|uniref:RICIN domain-containing protein n=1 Tax=Lentzea sp. NBRC 105346 TaxID=3032205 RepID=UPI0024A13559|nr:ricin-type beta-trefoil lectin domain protein [Lentzea sp. NBRC 105346]GLZ36329.1 hypothetical protein Lesp02_85160 [Lentzea sp. NBRC 105346]
MRNLLTVAAATVFAMTLLTAPAQADPVVHYRVAGTNRCLEDNGTQVVTAPCAPQDDKQRWLLPIGGDLSDRPRNIASNKCLTANATGQVTTTTCTSAINQRWRRKPRETEFRFRNVAANKCLVAPARVPTVQTCTSGTQRWAAFY